SCALPSPAPSRATATSAAAFRLTSVIKVVADRTAPAWLTSPYDRGRHAAGGASYRPKGARSGALWGGPVSKNALPAPIGQTAAPVCRPKGASWERGLQPRDPSPAQGTSDG